MNHSLEGILVFRLHRHTVTAVSHGDEGILQDSLITLRINDGRQLIMNGDIGLLDLLADIPQRGGSVVADLIRRQDAAGDALVQKLRDAKEAPILPAAAPKVVELAAKEFNIRQNESEGILGHLIAGGDLSLYGLANAVTRHAQDVQSYDRSTELEATGYKIITMQPSLLKRWNEEVSTV